MPLTLTIDSYYMSELGGVIILTFFRVYPQVAVRLWITPHIWGQLPAVQGAAYLKPGFVKDNLS
jgi:uncharacterized membrane protein